MMVMLVFYSLLYSTDTPIAEQRMKLRGRTDSAVALIPSDHCGQGDGHARILLSTLLYYQVSSDM